MGARVQEDEGGGLVSIPADEVNILIPANGRGG
jgi:hypothetical protein